MCTTSVYLLYSHISYCYFFYCVYASDVDSPRRKVLKQSCDKNDSIIYYQNIISTYYLLKISLKQIICDLYFPILSLNH